ncbi:MAG: amino acid permease [Pirellulales bacterium]
MPLPSQTVDATPSIAPRLGLSDTVSIIVGIVVGTAIFRSAPIVFTEAGGPGRAIALWLVGGALAWCGAVCYAELATTYPRDGGDYEYLSRAFGPWFGFLFAWAQLTAIISGNIAVMACAFADYGLRLWPSWDERAVLLAIAPVIGLSLLNALGVVAGKWAQNLLTAAKIIGIAGLVAAGLWVGFGAASAEPRAAAAVEPITSTNLGLALVFVLYAYGGWTHAAYVAAEVRDQRRNLPRALVLGIVGVMVVYLVTNVAYLAALGFDGARHTRTPAADVLEAACGPWGVRAISLLVMLSALGAINGMVLTASRIYAEWGADYPALAWLGAWNRRTAAPVAAITVQAVIAVLLIALVGTTVGRNFFDAALASLGLAALPWGNFLGGFEILVAGSAPVFWGLCLLTGVAVFVLRAKDKAAERPFRIPLFPLPPLVFCVTCAYMLWASAYYAKWLVLLGVVPLTIGGLLGIVARRGATSQEQS